MCLGPPAGIRLVGTLPLLRSRHLFLETLRVLNPPRAQDQTSIVNKKPQIPKRYPLQKDPGPRLTDVPRLCGRFALFGIWIWGFGFPGATVASPG
jgi:hypothetical protein